MKTYWHKISETCPKGHRLSAIEVSFSANLDLLIHWIDPQCGKDCQKQYAFKNLVRLAVESDIECDLFAEPQEAS